MAKRNLLNVRSVLETIIMLNDELLPITEGTPPIVKDQIAELAFYARAILRKHSHTRKDVRVNN
jgi:hypothetical protein